MLPLAAWLAWRTLRGRRVETAPGGGAPALASAWAGKDSEFYLVEKRLAQLGHARQVNEALGEWLARVAAQTGPDAASLQQLARLHYRHRFDPAGLPAAEREDLRAQAFAWLAQHPVQSY